MYNLIDEQKESIRWIVQKIRSGELNEEFNCVLHINGNFARFEGKGEEITEAPITEGTLGALKVSELLLVEPKERFLRHCTILEKAYQAVDSDFVDVNFNDTGGAKYFSMKKKMGVLLFILTVFITVLANIATQILPEQLRPYLWLSWPLLIIFTAISASLVFKQ